MNTVPVLVFPVAIVAGLRAVLAQERWADGLDGCRPRPPSGCAMRLIPSSATILTLALRFKGIGPDVLPLLLIVGTPARALTVMPLFGVGVLDATLLGAFTRPRARRGAVDRRGARDFGAASRCSARWCSARS
jgi:hypothetical protein